MTQKKRDDRIELVGIRIYPKIGVTAEERSSPQECEADLAVWSCFEGAASLDSIESSIDYTRVLETVRETASTGEYVLVETLAYSIVRQTLQKFPVNRTRVKIRKKPASLLGQIDFVEIEVEEP